MNTMVESASVTTPVSAPHHILQSVLAALNRGNIAEAVDQFEDQFTFKDQALGLEFADKARLSDFFHKSREFFPDAVLEVTTTMACKDRVIAEWKITATEMVPYGALQLRAPISFPGASIVRIRDGRITDWYDYYDQSQSRRIKLAAFFTDWIAL